MSTVHLAHDPNVDRQVALKLLPREFLHHPTFRERFNREARIIATLEHPAIVPIYDFGEEGGQPYFVMRFMRGGSLVERLKEGPLTIEEAASIIERIGSALQTAHAKGIVHRDLKPGNILFDQYGKAYLCDFGIARLQETGATLTGTVYLGTPAYMSPEQVQATSEVDGRADIYALGVILYEVLTGKKPFSANTAAGLALKHLTEPVPSILESKPDLPVDVERVISRAMAKDRDDRYASAMDMTNAVTDLTGEQTMIAEAVAPKREETPPLSDPMATMISPASASPPTSVTPVAAQPSTMPGVGAVPADIPVEPEERRRRRWLLPLLGGLGAIAIIVLVLALFVLPGDGGIGGLLGQETETPSPEPTKTTAPTPTTPPTPVPADTATPTPLPTRRPTNTPLPPTPTKKPTQAVEEPTLRPTGTATATSLPSPTRPPATATSPPSPTSPPPTSIVLPTLPPPPTIPSGPPTVPPG
jgi:serine/threonine-protein kinase